MRRKDFDDEKNICGFYDMYAVAWPDRLQQQ